jgi:hypothetical protein
VSHASITRDFYNRSLMSGSAVIHSASFFMCVWCRYVSPELNPEELPPDYMALASVVLGIVGLMLKVCAALVCPVGAGMPWC